MLTTATPTTTTTTATTTCVYPLMPGRSTVILVGTTLLGILASFLLQLPFGSFCYILVIFPGGFHEIASWAPFEYKDRFLGYDDCDYKKNTLVRPSYLHNGIHIPIRRLFC